MPTSARGETLVGVPEVVDGGSAIPADDWGKEQPLASRTRNLNRLSELGPPDVVYIRKRYAGVVGGSKTYGYYHFVRGVNVDSAASVSAYLVDLVNTGLDPQTWTSGGAYEIVGATFRSYNAISKVDVVVDLKLPGGTSAHAVNSDAKQVELNDALWAETALCAALRHAAGSGEHPLYPCLRVMQPTLDDFESTLLTSAAVTAPNWKLVGRPDRSELPTTPCNSRIAYSLVNYFLSFCRYDRAVDFFSSDAVSTTCSDALVHVATAHRLQGDIKNASVCIDEALRRNPTSAMAWVGRARIAKAQGSMEDTLEAATKACECESAGIAEFIALAEVCADLKKYQDAFIALNSSNIPQLELDYYLRDLVPNRGNKTTPVSGAAKGYDAVNVLAQRLKKERNAFNSKCDETLNELPGKMMTPTEHDCYEVLVKILNDIGWDRLLACRGSAFVMETDMGGNAESPAAGSAEKTTGGEDEEELKSDEEEGDLEEETMANGTKHEANDENKNPGANGGTAEEGDVTDAAGSVPKLDGPLPQEEVPGLAVESPVPDGLMDVPITPSEHTVTREKSHASRSAGKVVCKPWLDYLVTVMYEDLRAIAVWNAEERAFPAPSSNGPSSSSSPWTPPATKEDEEGGEGAATSTAAPPRRSPDEVASTSKRPAADWLRRGELALRLQRIEEAKTAFWVCIKLSDKVKTPAISARMNLMDLAASEGYEVTTLVNADAIWSWLDGACDKKSSSKPIGAPRPVQRAIFNLISKLGLRSVREQLANAEVDRNRIGTVLLDAVAWKVHGYST